MKYIYALLTALAYCAIGLTVACILVAMVVPAAIYITYDNWKERTL